MRRREFIGGTAALLVSPRRSWAQGPRRRVGYLDSAPLYLPNFKVWQDSLRDHGWIEGKNLIVDYRSAEGHAERVAPLANELVALKPDVLVGPSPLEALALKSATASIPIVFAAVSEPVRLWPCPKPVASRRQHNGSGSRRTGTFRRQTDTNPAGDGSYRLKNCGLGQPGQCNSQVDRSRAVARNCSEAGRDFPGTGGDHGGGTRHRLYVGRSPARRCNHSSCRCFDC